MIIINAASLQDLFAETPEEKERWERQKRRKQIKEQKVSEPYKLSLYSGIKSLDPNNLPETFVLDPNKSEQKLLWFTHMFIRGYNPVEYAKGHGDVLLTYQLDCKRHYKIVEYDDGTKEERQDEEIASKAEPAENSKFMTLIPYTIELPDGWWFTYKDEKFIGCSIPLTITKDMLSPSEIPE